MTPQRAKSTVERGTHKKPPPPEAPKCPECGWTLSFEADPGSDRGVIFEAAWRASCWNPECPTREVTP